MIKTQELVISRQDYETISSLVARIETKTGLLLEEELNRAILVDSND